MKTKDEIITAIEVIFENTKRIHGNNKSLDWIKVAVHKSAEYLASKLSDSEPKEVRTAGEMKIKHNEKLLQSIIDKYDPHDKLREDELTIKIAKKYAESIYSQFQQQEITNEMIEEQFPLPKCKPQGSTTYDMCLSENISEMKGARKGAKWALSLKAHQPAKIKITERDGLIPVSGEDEYDPDFYDYSI